MHITIRAAQMEDFPEIWNIFHSTVKSGDTYVFAPDTSYEEAKKYWLGDNIYTYVAVIENNIVGTYIIKPNHPGLGSHVANASYMVHPQHKRKKIGYHMAVHSLEEAKHLGFKAMQFNMVVATNTTAISLWKKLGFQIVGHLPKVFNHLQLGYVDAFVMHRFLE